MLRVMPWLTTEQVRFVLNIKNNSTYLIAIAILASPTSETSDLFCYGKGLMLSGQ